MSRPDEPRIPWLLATGSCQKSYTLEENQFLKFQPQDSIRTLLRLRLAEDKTTVKPNDNQLLKLNQQQPGLQVDISGKTQQILIGLNEELPVAKLQASFLEAWMPREAVIALIAFLSTLVMTLIGWLWEIATEEPESTPMNTTLQLILTRLKHDLIALYGDRLLHLTLFGSQARGDAEPGSDIDVLVVLKPPVNPGEEIQRTGQAIANLSLHYDVVVSCLFMDEIHYQTRNGSLLRNIRKEGIPL